MSRSVGQFQDFPEDGSYGVLFDGEAVNDDPIAVVDLLLVGIFWVHLEEFCLFCLDAEGIQADIDILEFEEPFLS